MEKRYQVFISSTSKDLQNARQEVSQALLRSDCFPAQMEQWPATDEEQFEFIKQVISQCDYYIVISAGMYGSIHPDSGLSYTEMEFDYAQDLGIPTIRLLHRAPFESLKGSQIEDTAAAREKLKAFRQKLLDGKMCAFWETPIELGREVILSLNDIKKRKPMDGWVKTSQMASADALIEIADLRREVSELKLRQAKELAPANVDEFLQGLVGSVILTRYELEPAVEVSSSSFRDDNLIMYHFRGYRKSSDTAEVEASFFAHKLLYGLLFSEGVDGAIQRSFVSEETDDSGYPLFIMGCCQKDDLEDIFMALESHAIISAGEQYPVNAFSPHRSYVESYPWRLTDVGREWVVANKPK